MPGARAGMSGSAKGLASVSGIVDAQQLIVVALIGMLVRAWVVRVVHARAKIRIIEVGVLMVQSESVADFLAGDEIAPNGGESGIRTHDTVSRIHAFQACALSHSAIPPAEAAPSI